MADSIVVFDLNGTVVDPSVLAKPLGDDPEGEQIVESALDLAIASGMVETLTGQFRPFSELLESALRQRTAAAGRDEEAVQKALAMTSRMPAFDHAIEAIELLADAGCRLAVATNSSTADVEEVLENAGLLDRFDLVMGTDEVGSYKPSARVYDAALERLGASPREAWLVAAHWWDVLGAQRAGLRGAWSAHKERVLVRRLVPDVQGADLVAVAGALLAAG